MSNILAMPQVRLQIETGNNEDWVDSIKFVVKPVEGEDPIITPLVDLDDESQWPQLDLRGITFEMEVRRAAADAEVILSASTANGTLAIGAPPDFGFLLIHIEVATMRSIRGGAYVADIVGRDEAHSRVIANIELTVREGVTKRPVVATT